MSTLTTDIVELDVLSQASGPSSQPSPPDQDQIAPEIPIDGHESPDIVYTEAQILPSTHTQQNAPAAPDTPRDVRAGFCRIAGSTLTSNLLVVPGLAVAIAGLAWMLLSQRYTMRNDRLQDCLNFRQVDIYSDVCNVTIDSGLPSFWRKREELAAISLSTPDEHYWFMFAFAIVLTLSAGILSIIWLRPKAVIFRPVISMVRTPPTITVFYHRCGTHSTPQTNIQDNILNFTTADEDDYSSVVKCGIKLSNGYVSSDDESDREDVYRNRVANDQNHDCSASEHIIRRQTIRGIKYKGSDAEDETALEATLSHAEPLSKHLRTTEVHRLVAKTWYLRGEAEKAHSRLLKSQLELSEHRWHYRYCLRYSLKDTSAESAAWRLTLHKARENVEMSKARLDYAIRYFQEVNQYCIDAGVTTDLNMDGTPLDDFYTEDSLAQVRQTLSNDCQDPNHQNSVKRVDAMSRLVDDSSGQRSVPWAGQQLPNIEQQIPAIELPEPHEPHEETPPSEHEQHDLEHQLSATMEAADRLSPNKDISEELVPGSPRIAGHQNSDSAPDQLATLSDEPIARDQHERSAAVSEIGQEQSPVRPNRRVHEAQRSIEGTERNAKRSFWSRLRRRPRRAINAEVE